jgi:hypothetical protein
MKSFTFKSNGVCDNPNFNLVVYFTDLLFMNSIPIEATPFFSKFSLDKTENMDSYQILMETVNYYSSLEEKDRILFAVYTALNPIFNRWQFGFFYNPYDDIQQDYNVLKGEFLDEESAKVAGFKYFLKLYDKQNFNDIELPFVNFIKDMILGKQLVLNF